MESIQRGKRPRIWVRANVFGGIRQRICLADLGRLRVYPRASLRERGWQKRGPAPPAEPLGGLWQR